MTQQRLTTLAAIVSLMVLSIVSPPSQASGQLDTPAIALDASSTGAPPLPPDPETAKGLIQVSTTLNMSMPSILIHDDGEAHTASLCIDGKEVIRFRASLQDKTPAERAEETKKRLVDLLSKGLSAREIKPGLENGAAAIRLGSELLLVVDHKTAEAAKQPGKSLAYVWANNLRQALGVEPLQRDSRLIASRGFIPLEMDTNTNRSIMQTLHGMASWYGPGFHGRRSSNGERFDMENLTAAHRFLPFGTWVRVINEWTGKSCVVRITDRGPFSGGRILDVSHGAARALGMLSSGVAPVTLQVLSTP